jgi:hypothetical protein
MSAAVMDRFKASSLGMRPRVPVSSCERKCNDEAHRLPTAPRGISHPRRGRSPGLWDRCVSPSRELALPVAGPRVGRKAPDSGCWLIRPRALTVAGAAEAWEGLGIPDSGRGEALRILDLNPLPHLFPVSPRRVSRAGTPRTSALIVQHKSQGSPLRRHRESTLKTNPYTLT